jgi:anti-sigma factor RsiW
MTATMHDPFDDLLAAYALDALDDDERDLVDRYLQDHPDARREVDRLRAAAVAFAAVRAHP